MYEYSTYEMILRRMLDRVDAWAHQQRVNIDTREGSLIRTALSPAAYELLQMYIELDLVLDESFADTQTRDFLIRRCKERGIAPYPETCAIRQGEFNMDVPIGSKFSLNKLTYIVTSKISDFVFQMRCETAGNIGNIESGALTPVDYINGLTWARLTDVLIPGEDEEATELLRQRYFNSLNSQAYGGNIQDYREKVLALPGVGGVKVYPVWNGGGTVKIVFLNSMFEKPGETLVNEVQTAIDPVQNQGIGLGIAPIGHIVTVYPVDELTVDIETTISFQPGWGWAEVKPQAEAAIEQYFTELRKDWDKVDWANDPTATLVVRISQIEMRLLNVMGIIDVQYTLLNNSTQNLTLGLNTIPKRGTVSNV